MDLFFPDPNEFYYWITDGNMACKEIVSLVGELENKLHIPLLKILNVKKLQGNLFIEKASEVLRILEMKGTPNLPDQLIEEILPLALPIGDFVVGPGLQIGLTIVRAYFEYIMPKYYAGGGKLNREVPEIVEQIGLIENKLEKFIHKTDMYDVWEDLRDTLDVVPCREVVRDLLQASKELKQAMNFFHDVGAESTAVCKYLEFFLRFIERLQSECSPEVVEGIRDVVNTALDAVKCPDKVRLRSQMRRFEDVLLAQQVKTCSVPTVKKSRVSEKASILFGPGLDSDFINLKENCIEKQAREFFEETNSMRLVLLDTLGKLHSLKGQIDMISKTLGDDYLQSWDPSFGSLQPSPYCLYLPEERKRTTNG